MCNFYVTGSTKPVTLSIGDEEPRQNQILMRKIILIQFQKLLITSSSFQTQQSCDNFAHFYEYEEFDFKFFLQSPVTKEFA